MFQGLKTCCVMSQVWICHLCYIIWNPWTSRNRFSRWVSLCIGIITQVYIKRIEENSVWFCIFFLLYSTSVWWPIRTRHHLNVGPYSPHLRISQTRIRSWSTRLISLGPRLGSVWSSSLRRLPNYSQGMSCKIVERIQYPCDSLYRKKIYMVKSFHVDCCFPKSWDLST